jgi:uncharacterized protein YlzI (FlbEa/FlbD family)
MFITFKGDAGHIGGPNDIVAINPNSIESISLYSTTHTLVEYLVGSHLRNIIVEASVVDVVKKIEALYRVEAADEALRSITSGSDRSSTGSVRVRR